MSNPCIDQSYKIKEIDSNVVTQNEIYDYWLSKRNIKDRFSDKNGIVDQTSAKDNLKWFAQEVLEVPYDTNQILTKKQVGRLQTSIDYYNKDLNGRFKNILSFLAVPRGLARLDPTSHNFMMGLERIKNYERNSIALTEDALSNIKDKMLYAHVKDNKTTFFGKKNLSYEKFRKLRDNLLKSENLSDISTARNELDKFMNTGDGRLLREYTELLNLNKKQLKKLVNEGAYYFKDNPITGKRTRMRYDSSVLDAVAQTKDLLSKVGKTHIKSLEGLGSLVDIKFGKNSPRAKSIREKLNSTILAIVDGTKEGDYFPSVPLETLHDIRVSVDKMLANKSSRGAGRDIDSAIPIIDRLLISITDKTKPDNLKSKNESLNTVWDKDPFVVIEKYATDAIQFNRNINTQFQYYRALKNIPSMGTEFVRGMKNFLIEEYSVFQEGTRGRPDWVNNMVRTINGFQTARTMGLNVTGGVKNALSISHYFSKVGLKAIQDSDRLYKGDLKRIVDRVEEEEGFTFNTKDATIFLEGFTGRDKINETDLIFDSADGQWKYKDTTVREMIEKSKDKTIGNLLFFHRLTENWQRKKMFRTSFIMKYNQLKDSGYVADKDITRFSKNYALSMVNGWAYEYSPFAKNKWVRGDGMIVDEIGDKVIVKKPIRGGLSEITFHLMHYPMSLMETHVKELRGAKESFMSGQGLESPELRYLMNYAGLFGMINLASVVLNGNLNNIVENETLNRIARIERDLTEYDNPDKATFGLLSEFTGPTIGHMKYASIVSGLIELDTPFNKIMLGNVDYSDIQNEDVLRYSDYQYSTEYGRMKHKILPAIRDGRGMDLVRHYLAFYPSEGIKKAREYLGLKKKTQLKSDKAKESALASLRHFG